MQAIVTLKEFEDIFKNLAARTCLETFKPYKQHSWPWRANETFVCIRSGKRVFWGGAGRGALCTSVVSFIASLELRKQMQPCGK